MLSPHELATLMLIGNGPQTRSDTATDSPEIDPVDLDALIAHELVSLEPSHDRPLPQITDHGRSMLKAVGRSC
ncbi:MULTISPECIES: hypothetical protein [unclassified Cupriavidus]|uniref:hypothetical protein n=1 Tax=Cupriavidus sp. H19C3 TaxID=3241603 RepID=UPI003BF80F02